MNPKSVEFLRDYNAWRRGTGRYDLDTHGTDDDFPDQPHPADIGEAIDWACEQIERMQWIPASERLPAEDDGVVAVLLRSGDILTAWASYWHGASNEFAHWTFPHEEDSEATEDVTHWTPLPPPPGETK